MAKFMVPVCASFANGACRKRLDYYVEREATQQKLVIEKVPCIFYIEGRCGLKNDLIGYYIRGYPQPKTYERKEGIETEIERPAEPILSPRPA